MEKKSTLVLTILILFQLVTACTSKQAKVRKQKPKDSKEIRIGITQDPAYSDLFTYAIKPELERRGYKIKEVPLANQRSFNAMVGDGEVDLNVGQHKAYLDYTESKDRQNLSSLITIPSPMYAIYSNKLKAKNLAQLKKELKKGDYVTIPSDPSNLACALVFLEKNGLIKLKDGPNKNYSSEYDIVENPYGLKIVPVESAQQIPTLSSVAFGVILGTRAINAKIFDKQIVKYNNPDESFIIMFAVRTEDLNSTWAQDFKSVIESEAFKNIVEDPKYIFHNYYRPEWYVKKWGIKND